MSDETTTTPSGTDQEQDPVEPTRSRTRNRSRRVGRSRRDGAEQEAPAAEEQAPVAAQEAPAAEDDGPGAEPEAPAAEDQGPAEQDADTAEPAEAPAGDGDERVIRRTRRRGSRGGRRRRSRTADAGTEQAGDEAADGGTADDAGAAGEAQADAPAGDGEETGAPGRGRGKAAGRGAGTGPADRGPGRKARTKRDGDKPEPGSADTDEEQGQPTRLQTRRATRGRGRSKGRRTAGAVSEETRRAIAEGPPRRMLVTVGQERTQIAVLEERTLVEHYVTRRADVSYVGNVYLGRVQNVLPGMEAAFVDIGKGRNGVLYAGEVDYDEEDLDGDLPRIEQTLKPGQTVLVQVTKDPMGTKGARLTQHLSIAGRYCVLAPGEGMLGISRKLPDEERERLRRILKDIKPEGFGLIVRTAAEGATKEQLETDVARLSRIWDQVQKRAADAKPLDAVYEEPGLVMRVIRDIFGTEYSDLVIDDESLVEQVRDYLGDVSPDMVDKVQAFTGEESLFDAYQVTTQVRRALEKKVWLRSGGYLIVEKTEAMWVIDVNTGKFVGKDNLEETVLRNNIEAAEEIARQLRLRDMGGIIVIDFVDMLIPANRDEVLKRFKRELARDKTKSRVMDISKLGLVQMTRKNVSQGLFENFTTRCETCEGRGARILDEAFH